MLGALRRLLTAVVCHEILERARVGGFGDHPDQDTGDPAWRLCAPDAPAASCVAPCAFVAVRDITGRMLLVRRCATGDWELPGGDVDPGESASDAAVRETAEESGITVEVTGLVGIYTDPGHVIADPRAGLVRQPFAVCCHGRPLSGSPGGDQVETCDARVYSVRHVTWSIAAPAAIDVPVTNREAPPGAASSGTRRARSRLRACWLTCDARHRWVRCLAAISCKFRIVSSLCAPRCQKKFFFLPVADYAAECSLKPSGMTPSFA